MSEQINEAIKFTCRPRDSRSRRWRKKMTKPNTESARAFFEKEYAKPNFNTIETMETFAQQCVDAALAEKWIKCEDRLPDYDTLPSDEDDDPRILIATAKGKVFVANYGSTFYNVCDESKRITDVIAWMPLPEYTEQI
ncbi:DUF551 domain-containing protein [Geitlerinema calcuttense]|uniref:DUF551 domain-containing protein n=1 Tax=Geitlerinema calcuttense NRMC-F 0142 TaxID=2922238 RepID=A0ABT7LUZ0_9CYAN|nr:DUF551 domain-containing protein [Geitlerinema calcuttense]MDL5055871.1 DUF551 domain-containing protein [Geitlerinema calcuttense NRMC-F 0142]